MTSTLFRESFLIIYIAFNKFEISSLGSLGWKAVIHCNPLNFLSRIFASIAFFIFTLLKSIKSLLFMYLFP